MSNHSPQRLTHQSVIDQLSLSEKAALTSGENFWNTAAIERLGIPSIMLTDGPHGLRKQGGKADHLGLNKSLPATCFPTAATLANSWDVELLTEVGQALGAEAAAENVSVLLGPGLNIKRNPLGGRNFEYFSEDPHVSGQLAAAFIRGVQSHNVAACPKHFAVNSQETFRMSVDEIVDQRALHEIYLEGFRVAITQGRPHVVMSAYNQVNGTFAHEHPELLQEILRNQWGFDGVIVSDWGGNNDRIASIKATATLEMPSTHGITDAEVIAAVESGQLDEHLLDARVNEILELISATTAPDTSPEKARSDSAAQRLAKAHAAHHELAVEAARQSIILLKNQNHALPLLPVQQPADPSHSSPQEPRVAVIGDFAQNPRYQGAGSSLVNPTQLTSALDALRKTDLHIIGFEPGFKRLGGHSSRRHHRALELAQQADTVLLFLGLAESAEAEGVDREHMHLDRNQLRLVGDLLKQRRHRHFKLIVILAGGAPVELPFEPAVDAIVHGYLPGQGGGQALADVLTGATNPSGKLTETYPLRYSDVPSAPYYAQGEATAEHRESIYVGYRYYDKAGIEVRYPFGHGLSYTTFEYSDLKLTQTSATLTLTNTGSRSGAEVVQLYVQPRPDSGSDPAHQFRAVSELRGFTKVHLAPGQSRSVTIDFAEHSFDIFDADAQEWVEVPGSYDIAIGASSRDIRLRAELVIPVSAASDSSVAKNFLPLGTTGQLTRYLSGDVQQVTREEFATLLGRPLPPAFWDPSEPLHYNSIISQGKGRRGAAGLLYRAVVLTSKAFMALGKPIAANNVRFALALPYRAVARMTGGKVSMAELDALLLVMNNQPGAGLKALMKLLPKRISSFLSNSARKS